MTDQERIKNWVKENGYRHNVYIMRQLKQKFTDKQIVFILDLLDNICKCCWSADEPCCNMEGK